MTYQHIKYTIEESLGVIAFNRPDQLNAMNRRMMEEIIHALGALSEDPTARVGMITGLGRAFMAGADIKEYANQTFAEFVSFQTLGRSLYAGIESNAKPIIAAVNGYAFGGGFEIALSCDMIVASATAKFGLPEINLHLIPGGGGTQRATRKLGINRANELLMTGRNITAEELQSWGIVNHVYPQESFAAEVRTFAAQFVKKSPRALQSLKQLTQLAAGCVSSAALCLENDMLAQLYQSNPAQTAIQTFYQQSLERARAKKQATK